MKWAKGAMKATKRRASKQLEFPGMPKSRKFKGKFDIYGDGRGILLAGLGIGLGGLGVGEGVRRARSKGRKKK